MPLLKVYPAVKLEFQPTFDLAKTESHRPRSNSIFSNAPSSPRSLPSADDSSNSMSEPMRQKRKYTKRKGTDSIAESSSKRLKAESDCDSVGSDSSNNPEISSKKERRKQQNRAAAATSRMKKKAYMDEMQMHISELVAQQQNLLQSVQMLRSENEELKQQVASKRSISQSEATLDQSDWDDQLSEVSVFDNGTEHVSADHESISLSTPSTPSSSPQSSYTPLASPTNDSVSVISSPESELNTEFMHDMDFGSEFSEWFNDCQSDAFYESAVLASPLWKAHLARMTTMMLLSIQTSVQIMTSVTCAALCVSLPHLAHQYSRKRQWIMPLVSSSFEKVDVSARPGFHIAPSCLIDLKSL